MLPNFYTDDQWNELTDDDRRMSNNVYEQALTMSSDECVSIIESIEAALRDYGPIDSSDTYNDYHALLAEQESWLDMLDDILAREKKEGE